VPGYDRAVPPGRKPFYYRSASQEIGNTAKARAGVRKSINAVAKKWSMDQKRVCTPGTGSAEFSRVVSGVWDQHQDGLQMSQAFSRPTDPGR
jgi:hypothetical protein